MKLLAIDSSGDSSSVALIYEDEILSYSKTHARKERPNWNDLLGSVGLNSQIHISEIDCFAFGRGPGSYTGIRSLASFMKGLSWTQKKPLVGISNLQSIAYQANTKADNKKFNVINVALKSDLDEVYFCKYPSSALLETQSDEKVLSYKELADPMLLSNPSAIYAGNGWDDERIKLDASSIVKIHSDALSIAHLAELKFNNQDKFLPEDANPVYLKDTNYKKISDE